MNPRERLIATLVGVAIAGVVAWFAFSWYLTELNAKTARLQKLTSEVRKKKLEERKAQQASQRLASYEERSLPPVAGEAKSLYEKWLLQIASEVQPELNLVHTAKPPTPPVRNTFSRLSFTVRTQGELPQLIDFLYRIQRVDWLHRIDTLSLVPQNNSRRIDMVLNISALSVRTAPRASELTEIIGEKYKNTMLADYREPILNRNFFNAPNRKPQLDIASRTEAIIDRTFEQTIKGTDPDPFDRVGKFRLVKSDDPTAKLDPVTGKFTWRPKSKGEFAFEIAAEDDGLPAQTSDVKRLLVTVKDPPPRVAEAPRKPAFDDAKYTVLTAVINDSGAGEIWLNVRPKGENRILQEGDKFEIGSVKGEVSEIGIDDVLLLVDGKLRRMVTGDTLAASSSGD